VQPAATRARDGRHRGRAHRPRADRGRALRRDRHRGLDGRSFAEIRADDPDGYARFERSDPTFRYPGGESFAEQSDRVQAGLADLRAQPAALPALVVCHRGVIRLALAVALGDETAGGREIANASLVTL
jgi:broad specificity phosphatase PhoE